MAVQTLTLLGAAQYTGLFGFGLFSMLEYAALPRTTRILSRFSYTELVDDPITTNIRVFAVRPGGNPTEVMVLSRGLWQSGLLDPADGNAYMKSCSDVIPREPGNGGLFWDIQVISDGKANTGTVTIDVDTCPSPDTSPQDSPQ